MKFFRLNISCLASSLAKTFFASATLLSFAVFSAHAAPESETPADTAMLAAHAAANGDILLESLLTELDRSKAKLKMDQVQAPYYIEYRVSDLDEYGAEAAFGSLRENQHAHVRILRVVVRIGDYKVDSFFGQGIGNAAILPLDDDPLALRHQIWLATDEAYKAAGEAYAEKLSALKQFSADTNPVNDFAKAPVLTQLDPTVKLQTDDDTWKKTLEEITGIYRQYPEVQFVSASTRFSSSNEYFVNSEGTVTREGHNTYSVALNAATQAEDGMRLGRSPYWTVARFDELPSRETLMTESKQMLESLRALRSAPVVEDEYRGPVLFAPDAANDIMAALVGANILGRKPQLGKPNRTIGSFATSYKARVMPKFVSVVDDPTLKEFQGKSLVGNYDVDSEGVKAQSVTAIDGGVLTNYLLGRQPLRDFPASNGHGRASPGMFPGPSLGVMIVKSTEAQSPEALKKKIMQMVTDQDRPYAYRVETMGGMAPRLLYRMYGKDGHEELVRGAVFSELDIRALRSDLVALGNDPMVSNRSGGVPQTVITPSLLFSEMEVKRADTSKDKLPEYPAPPLEKK
ncbi:MAG TPA: metallopeptidase TldD-related protein [Candidatus Dormibacteraeota bacterium]|nr:metallopeptidase TldD-related protein [Candidatus Dormibacteraeota bacterium]